MLVINLANFGLIFLANFVIGIGYEITSSRFISVLPLSFHTTTVPGSSAAKSSSQVAGLTKT